MMSRGVIEKLLSGAGAHTWAPSGPRVIIEERAESDQANMELFQTSFEMEQRTHENALLLAPILHPAASAAGQGRSRECKPIHDGIIPSGAAAAEKSSNVPSCPRLALRLLVLPMPRP